MSNANKSSTGGDVLDSPGVSQQLPPVAAVYDRPRCAGEAPKTTTMETTLTERRYNTVPNP